MRWNPGTRSRADLNSEEGASENSCRERAEITTRERRAYAPRRSFRDSNTSAMGDNGCDLTVGSTMQLYQGDVGLQPVLQIAGACLARETRRLASARPLGILRGARVTRAASPRRLQRFQRCLSTRGFARSTDHHPRYRLPADLRALENKTEGAEKRYRVMLSDGVHYVTAMLTSSLNQ